MVIKGQGETNPDYEENREHGLIIKTGEEQTGKVDDENYKLSRNYIGHDRTHEKPFFAFENRATRRAPVDDIEGTFDD